MVQYIYKTTTGPIKIYVDENWAALLCAEDADEMKSERKHTRADHKYASGAPIHFDSLQHQGELLVDQRDEFGAVIFLADLKNAFSSLTKLQRLYFIKARLEDLSYIEIAGKYGKNESTVREIVKAADKKIKKILYTSPDSGISEGYMIGESRAARGSSHRQVAV